MLMLHGTLYLVTAAYLSQPSLLHQTQVLEQTKTPIHSGQANGLILAVGTPIELSGIYMPTGIMNQV
jgi:hypothetical protein